MRCAADGHVLAGPGHPLPARHDDGHGDGDGRRRQRGGEELHRDGRRHDGAGDDGAANVTAEATSTGGRSRDVCGDGDRCGRPVRSPTRRLRARRSRSGSTTVTVTAQGRRRQHVDEDLHRDREGHDGAGDHAPNMTVEATQRCRCRRDVHSDSDGRGRRRRRSPIRRSAAHVPARHDVGDGDGEGRGREHVDGDVHGDRGRYDAAGDHGAQTSPSRRPARPVRMRRTQPTATDAVGVASLTVIVSRESRPSRSARRR